MGLFVLDLKKPQTKKSMVTAAIGNLNLYLEELESSNDYDNEYLLTFARNYIALAINKNKT